MKKKQKWSFVDLDDKDFETINKEQENNKEEQNLNINLHDLKNESKKNNEIKEEKKDIVENTTSLTEEDFEPIKKVQTKKIINYEVNYDDILKPEENEKKEIIKELFEQKKDVNKKNNNNDDENKEFKNLKPRNTLKTYNEALKKQEDVSVEKTNFEEEKIKQFLTVKEKLDIKTNIYLKSSVVIKLRELEEKTNESRSSIINKLIEIALKTIEQ